MSTETEVNITCIGDTMKKFLNTRTGAVREELYDLVVADGTREKPCSMCGALPYEPHRGCILR